MEHFVHALEHAFEHSVLDTLQMIPILLAVYLLMEFLEKKMGKWQHSTAHLHQFGPIAGALAGCIPQCGFSAAAASLYSQGFLTGGTLVAVFLSTSDEAIPVMMASRDGWKQIAALLGAKIILAAIAGYLLQYTVFRKQSPLSASVHSQQHGSHRCCQECARFRSPIANAIWNAVRRTIQVSVFIAITILAVETIIHMIGEDQLNRFLLQGSILQPLLTALIGLIPGCAVSVLLTQLFLGGSIGFGAAVAGLATGAGVGYLVLLKECRDIKRIVQIISCTYLCAAVAGVILTLLVG